MGLRRLMATGLICGGAMLSAAAMGQTPVVVENKVLNRVDPRLFGQFLERAGSGEPGPEAGADRVTGELPPRVVAMLREMQIPVIRFPGGTDIDYIDWRDLVSNVPGRQGKEGWEGRPLTAGRAGDSISNRFGVDEYFALQKQLGCETILVVNFLDALSRKKPLAEAARTAAGLVAYTNAPVGAKLPEGMPDWPGVRAKNGHAAPFGVRYFQIGNEWWLLPREKITTSAQREDRARWITECVLEYVRAMREVDASIEIIIDGDMGDNVQELVLTDERVRKAVQYAALHTYAPGSMDQVELDGKRVPASEMTDQAWWRAWSAMPGFYGPDGEARAFWNAKRLAGLGYRIAATEWNWNGWSYARIVPRPAVSPWGAAAIGTGGFLNGLMRDGEYVVMANQSMLVGKNWGIAAVHLPTEEGGEPYYSSQATVTTLYNRHHGGNLLSVRRDVGETYPQSYRVGWCPPAARVAVLDIAATGDEQHIWVHAVNRDPAKAHEVAISLEGFKPAAQATQWLVLASVNASSQREAVRTDEQKLETGEAALKVTLPAASVSVIEISLK